METQIVVFVTLLAFVNTNIIQNIQKSDNADSDLTINKTKEDNINENNDKDKEENFKEEEKQLELDNVSQINTANKEDIIKELEYKRDDIMKNITKEIDDSITMLQKTNDSDAFIKDLKELRSDIVKLDEVYTKTDSNDTRKLSKLHNYMKKLPREMQIRIINDRKLFQEKAAKMFKKLQDEADERRKKMKKARRSGGGRKYQSEKCSKYGFKSGSKDSYEYDRKSKKKRIKEPCCRKCCEKSYLGCL